MICLDATLIVLFIMFNFVFTNPDNGIYPMMSDMAKKTITNPHFLSQTLMWFSYQNEYFDFSMITSIVLTVIVGIMGALGKTSPQEE